MKKPSQRNPISRRTVFIGSVMTLGLIAVAAQLGNMTIVQQRQYRQEAEGQRTRSLPIFAPRGTVYDRNMLPMVTNRSATSVFLRYPYYKQADVVRRLSAIVKVPIGDIEKLGRQKLALGAYYEPIRVKDDITPEQYTLILEQKSVLPGVEVQAQPVRLYPLKDVAAHVLGYVGEISEADLKLLEPKGYIGGEAIGQTGLEAHYDEQLHGKPGMRQVEINNAFQPLGEVRTIDPIPGRSLVLTIDANLQRVAERALDWDMWRIRNTVIGDGPWRNAKAGAVVAMDVKTGAILAMASRPAYDPNIFATGISPAELKRLHDPILTPEVNRAVQTAYQPGSTWKMLTSAAALSAGVIGPYDSVFCPGVYDKAGHPKDWVPYGHGFVNTVTALKGSCDIYYYEMGYRLQIDRLVAMAQQFGMGAKTGIDIGGENPGLLPDAQAREEIWAKRRNDQWSVGHTVSAAIGQIVNVTPLQLVRYTAVLGNGGKLMKPHLVQRIVDGHGNVLKELPPEQVGTVKLVPEHFKAILEGMAAVDEPGGTSDYSIWPLPGIKTGSKTGSAEYPPWDEFGFHVSLAPLDNPQIAVAVVIEQATHGSNTSAVARAVQAAYFNVKLPLMDPANVPPEFPNDLAGLRRKYQVIGTGE